MTRRLKKIACSILTTVAATLIAYAAWSCIRPAELTAGQPAVIMVVLDPTLNSIAPTWQHEIARRFPNAVGVFVHGNNYVEDEWIASTALHATPEVKLARKYKRLFPGRTIVILSCNPGHLKLGEPDVYYAMSNIWLIPDRELKLEDGGLGRLTMNGDPTTQPSTQPAAPLFDLTPLSFLRPTQPQVVRPDPTRWERDPDCVGNIFEFVKD
jgi:hypothetical protein